MPNKLNILVIPAWYDVSDPFAGIFFHEYCNALSKNCNMVLLNITAYPLSAKKKGIEKVDRHLDRSYSLINIDHHNRLPGRLLKLFPSIDRNSIINKSLSAVRNYQSKNQLFDLIHIQSVCNNVTPTVAKSLSESLKIPYVVTEHYTSFKEAGERIFQPFSSFSKTNKIVNKASARYGVSTFACNYYKNIFGSTFELMPNLIHDSFIDNRLENKKTNKDLFTFICVGSFQIRKGQSILIEAFSMLESNCKLILIGGGPDKQKMMDLIAKYKLEERVIIYDKLPKEKILDFIDQSDILISASERETFGLTIAEAFFRGKPVISTRSGGPEDLINKSNGLLCEVGSASDLQQKMTSMMSTFDKYDAKLIQKNAVSSYSEAVISEAMVANYKKIIGKKTIKN